MDQTFANKERDFIMKYRVSLVTKEQMDEADEVSMFPSVNNTWEIPHF